MDGNFDLEMRSLEPPHKKNFPRVMIIEKDSDSSSLNPSELSNKSKQSSKSNLKPLLSPSPKYTA